MHSDRAANCLLSHDAREMIAVLVVIEDGLSAGSTQDYVVEIVRLAHAGCKTAPLFGRNLITLRTPADLSQLTSQEIVRACVSLPARRFRSAAPVVPLAG